MKPLVSVVILNWNGKQHLLRCLTSLAKATYRPVEIIVVDNNSTDGSADVVRTRFPNVRVIQEKENRGYSGGNNDGIAKSRGKYIFILNNDTEVERGFLEPLVAILESDPSVGCVQPKLVYGDRRRLLNAVGSYLTSTGFLYHYGYRKDASLPQYNRRLTIYSAKGAAMLLPKSALDRVGTFDEDFFIYFEETDLCHRLWLAGYRIVYEPAAVIYHYEAVDTHRQMENSRIMYLSYRNRIASFIKNLSLVSLLALLPALLVVYGFLFLVYVVTGQWATAGTLISAIGWNISILPVMITKRRFIQKNIRKRTDTEIFRFIRRSPPLLYYYFLFTSLEFFTHEPSLVEANRY